MANLHRFRRAPTRGTQLYAWGLSASGAFGNPNHVKQRIEDVMPGRHAKAPASISIPLVSRHLRDIAAGHGFSLFVTKRKIRGCNAFGVGLNTNSQLGYHPAEDARRTNAHWILAPQPLLPGTGSRQRVEAVSAGRAHSLMHLSDNTLRALGNNAHGQCGRPIVEMEDYEQNRICSTIEIDGKIKQIVSGLEHNLVLTDEGKVFAFGCGNDGQLGSGKLKSSYEPTLVTGDLNGEKIVHVHASADCNLAVSDKGHVFGWGNSEYGQLAASDSSNSDIIQQPVARHLKFNIGKVKRVAAAATMCAALNESGEVYVWGYGILGLGPKVTSRLTPEVLPQPLFGSNALAPERKVKSVYAGLHYFAAISDNDELFTWGKNADAQLGLENFTDQLFPFKVTILDPVEKVACGPLHMLAICRSSFL